LGAIADDTHARPEIDGAADAVAARRDEHDALPFAGLQLVDRCLHGVAIVLFAVAMGMELIRGEIHRRRVFQTCGIGRCREAACCNCRSYEQSKKKLSSACLQDGFFS
jgi:hypothetical protein